jgi:alkylhydroperoxidase family enzyme
MQAGASEEKIRQIEGAGASPLFADRERVALEFAEAMTVTGQKVNDELFQRVRRHFSEPEIVELTAAVALENFRSKFNVALGIEAQGFCALRTEMPSQETR